MDTVFKSYVEVVLTNSEGKLMRMKGYFDGYLSYEKSTPEEQETAIAVNDNLSWALDNELVITN